MGMTGHPFCWQRGQEVARLCVQSEAEGYEIYWGVQHGVGGKSEAEYTVLY